jgi:hypothetical protein
LPRSAGVDVDAHASGGRVTSAFPVTETDPAKKKQGGMAGKINGGGPALFLRASSGDIRITESPTQQAEADK